MFLAKTRCLFAQDLLRNDVNFVYNVASFYKLVLLNAQAQPH